MKLGRMILACMLAVGGASLARADESINKEAPIKKGTVLTHESLETIVDQMGLSPKKGSYTSGIPYYDILMKHNGWDTPVRVAMSSNKQVVWLHVNLAELPPVDQVPADALINLLKKNGSAVGKAQFCVRGNAIYLLQSFDNVEVTPAKIRKELEDMADSVKTTHKDWDPKEWKAGPPAPIKENMPASNVNADLLAFEGTWTVVSAVSSGNVSNVNEGSGLIMKIQDGKVTLFQNGNPIGPVADLRANSDRFPKEFNFVSPGNLVDQGIFKLEGDTLTICYTLPGQVRPTDFVSKADDKSILIVLKRS